MGAEFLVYGCYDKSARMFADVSKMKDSVE